MSESIREIINRQVVHIQRPNVYIKRIKLDGDYESEWYDISKYFVSGGDIKRGFSDNLFFGYYEIDDVSVQFDNSNRKFNDENDFNSLFKGFLSRYRTKFKIVINFIDSNDEEVLLTTFYGLLLGNPTTSDNGIIEFDLASPIKMLENYSASSISTSTPVTSEGMVTRLLSDSLVSRFFEGISINPTGDTTTTITTPTIEESDTFLTKLNTYTLFENFFYYIDDNGYFVWRNKDVGVVDGASLDTSVQWEFVGAGSYSDDYATNIISVNSEYNDVDNFISKVVIDNGTENVSETSFTVGDGSDTDIYGSRVFNYDTTELDNTNALIVAERIREGLNEIKKIWEIEAVPAANLIPSSNVKIKYEGLISVNNPFILGFSTLGGSDVLAGNLGSINLQDQSAKLMQISFNIDNFKTNFKLREV